MGSAPSVLLFLVMVLAEVFYGIKSLQRIRFLATEFASYWQDEYAVRRCGALASEFANLGEAAQLIGQVRPDLANAAQLAKLHLQIQIRKIYDDEPMPDASYHCMPANKIHLAAYLHKEHHPGQSKLWPNWTYELVSW